MITRDLRRALARAVAAAGFRPAQDPGLRPTGTPGQYAASVALSLGPAPRETAAILAAILTSERWIAKVEVTGPGYLTVTVTPAALAAVADTITAAGPACVTSDALVGLTVPTATAGDPLTAPTWEKARVALAAQLTARLAAAAGATAAELASPERVRLTPSASTSSGQQSKPIADPAAPDPTRPGTPPYMSGAPRHDIYGNFMTRAQDGPGAPETVARAGPFGVGRTRSDDPESEPDAGPRPTEVMAAVAFAGRDAVIFTLARAIPGKPLRVVPEIIARHVLSNPAYAVRYAHARAASGLRWAVISRGDDPPYPPVSLGGAGLPLRETTARPRPPADPGERILLDALSWLPERVATAARRGRPDEFARYLEDLASVTVDVLSSVSHPGNAPVSNRAPGSDRLTLAKAAQTGLAAGLGLLGVSAPNRL